MREMTWDGPTTILSEQIATGVEITTVFELRRLGAAPEYAVRSTLRMADEGGVMRAIRAYDRVVGTTRAVEQCHEHTVAVAIETMLSASEERRANLSQGWS